MWYTCLAKEEKGNETYYTLSNSFNRFEISKSDLKKDLSKHIYQVFNLQLNKAGQLIERNPSDTDIAKIYKRIILDELAKLKKVIRQYNKKNTSDIVITGNFYKDIRYTGFIVGYKGKVVFENKELDFLIDYAYEDGYYLFIDGENYEYIKDSIPNPGSMKYFIRDSISQYFKIDFLEFR